jgi:hypothetical protein
MPDFLPSPAVALSLGACALLPAVLLILSHGPLKVEAPGRRFVRAAGLTAAAWVGLMLLPAAPESADVAVGALLLLTALLAGFTLWTLVAWGFTLTMLLTLARAGGPLREDGWVLGYTGGKPIAAFARDRLGVLFRLRLAEPRGEAVAVTPGRGRLLARVVGPCRAVFGLPR